MMKGEHEEKKTVRYFVSGDYPKMKSERRQFMIYDAAVCHHEGLVKLGYTNVALFKNTRTFKTERLL